MNPLYMLFIDGMLLGGVVLTRKACGRGQGSRTVGRGRAAMVAAIGIAVAFGMPARTVKLEDPSASGSAASAGAGTTPEPSTAPPAINRSNDTTPAIDPPAVTPPAAASSWPARPAQVQPYYLPDFATWVGKPLASQPEMALLDAPPPATIGSGTWIIMLYRADCEHCHEVLETHFVGSLKRPALLIGIPDHDPANEQPMPCTECTIRTFLKGPNYVVQTPVVMRIKDGMVEAVCTDHEDAASLADVLEGGS
jgi:hypothetical protein